MAVSKKLLEEVMALDDDDRSALGVRLIDSAFVDQVAEHDAWTEVIDARVAEVEAGTVKLIPADEVFAALK